MFVFIVSCAAAFASVAVLTDDVALADEASKSDVPLTKQDVDEYVDRLWNDYSSAELQRRQEENASREIKLGGLTMPFWYRVFGETPEGGRSLFISMHGGGSAPPSVNDRQYENQKRLYQPDEGVYFVPRAPTNTWNLWHEAHIDHFVERIIENMVLLENINPNRVYIMGYSAGGDGVFQLAPRLADRLAAAAMMAGHPNETTPEGLRNLPFAIHMGQRDASFNRNKKAAEWESMLSDLHQQDPGGYIHQVTIHQGLGHWVNRQDAVAVPWMAKYSRRVIPDRIVWKQDDRLHNRFYWLAVKGEKARARSMIRVKRDGQAFLVEESDVNMFSIRVNDDMIKFDQDVTVTYGGKVLFNGRLVRSKAVVQQTFKERHDRTAVFSAEIQVDLASGD